MAVGERGRVKGAVGTPMTLLLPASSVDGPKRRNVRCVCIPSATRVGGLKIPLSFRQWCTAMPIHMLTLDDLLTNSLGCLAEGRWSHGHLQLPKRGEIRRGSSFWRDVDQLWQCHTEAECEVSKGPWHGLKPIKVERR